MQSQQERYKSFLTDDFTLFREESPIHFNEERDDLGSLLDEMNHQFSRNFDEFSKEKAPS